MKLRRLNLVFVLLLLAAPTLAAQQTTARAVLHKPADVVRGAKQSVAIRYSLPSRADSVRIEILDAEGKVIRTLDAIGNIGAGNHRLVWDMRGAPATALPDLDLHGIETGPRVVPGHYRVRLKVDRQQPQTQRFAIKPDPRYPRSTSADLQAQHEMALDARARLSKANEAVVTIRDLKRQVDDRVAKARDPKFEHGARLLKDKLTQVEEELHAQTPVAGRPLRINEKIVAVIAAVDTVEGRPSSQAHEMLNEVSARLDQQLNWLEQIYANDLKQFNTQFITWKKLEPIERRTFR